MAKTFHLTIARVGENIFEGEAERVTLPGVEGMFTVLAGHEAFVTPLAEGQAHVKAADGAEYHVPIHDRGIAEISRNQTTVLL